MKRRLLSIIVPTLFALLAAGCSGDEANSSTAGRPNTPKPEKVTHVEVMNLARTDVHERFTLPGTLKAWEDLTLAAEVVGPVTWIGPQEGERLKQGAAILRIDPETRQANYDRDQVEADLAAKQMQRMQTLVEQNLVSRQEYENSVNAYERARSALRLSTLQLEKSTLRMPVAGVLDDLLVDRGEYVKAGDPAAVVVQIDRLKVEVDVPEKDIPFLHLDEKVEVVQANIGRGEGIRRPGKVVHLAYKADPVTRTYRCLVELDNRDLQLRPGMIVKIEAVRRDLPQALIIPLYSMVDREGKKVVYIKSNGTAQERQIDVETILGDRVVVRSGVVAGETLIVKGQHLVTDGAPVAVGDE